MRIVKKSMEIRWEKDLSKLGVHFNYIHKKIDGALSHILKE